MRRIQQVITLALGLSLSVSAFSADNFDKVREKVKSVTNMDADTIANSPIDGLLEVTAASQIFYITEDATYLFFGHVYDMNQGMKDITEASLSALRIEAIDEYADDAIEFKAKDEKHVISVFTDYSCGYCRKLHKEVGALNDAGITVRYLAWPRAGLGTDNYTNMVSIWCADNPQEALTNAKEGGSIKPETCDNTVAEQFMAGRKLGISGTPAIVLENGTMIPGYKPARTLIQEINDAS